MTKYFKAEHSKSKILVSPRVYTLRFFLFAKAHKKKRKGFERKTLVFIRFDEEGTIFKKEKRLKSLFFYEKYGISKFDGYLYKTKRY